MKPDEEEALPHIIRVIVREEITAVREEITAAEQRITAAITAAEARAQEFARDIETSLLTAFHGHAKGQTARLHTTEVTTADLSTRMAALEERMLNLETRRPPQ
jgi:hypothetical protein